MVNHSTYSNMERLWCQEVARAFALDGPLKRPTFMGAVEAPHVRFRAARRLGFQTLCAV
jgi:hypothetical protein